MFYFDDAFIAKFYLQEPESDAVRAFTEDSPGITSLIIGRLETELVLSRKLREGALTPQGHEAPHRPVPDGLRGWSLELATRHGRARRNRPRNGPPPSI